MLDNRMWKVCYKRKVLWPSNGLLMVGGDKIENKCHSKVKYNSNIYQCERKTLFLGQWITVNLCEDWHWTFKGLVRKYVSNRSVQLGTLHFFQIKCWCLSSMKKIVLCYLGENIMKRMSLLILVSNKSILSVNYPNSFFCLLRWQNNLGKSFRECLEILRQKVVYNLFCFESVLC